MAQDLRELLKEDQQLSSAQMSEGHKARFLEKLDKELPRQQQSGRMHFWSIAASVVVLLGLSYGALQFGTDKTQEVPVPAETPQFSSLGDVSPELKKVEDYYLASINTQLSQIKLTPENKELMDGYLMKLNELNKEYQRLNKELTEDGPNALTIDALINNLKLRLSLLTRLQEQIKALEAAPEAGTSV
jgi:hypothetical protein